MGVLGTDNTSLIIPRIFHGFYLNNNKIMVYDYNTSSNYDNKLNQTLPAKNTWYTLILTCNSPTSFNLIIIDGTGNTIAETTYTPNNNYSDVAYPLIIVHSTSKSTNYIKYRNVKIKPVS